MHLSWVYFKTQHAYIDFVSRKANEHLLTYK